MEEIKDAIASLCADILRDNSACDNKMRAESIFMLVLANNLLDDGDGKNNSDNDIKS